MARIPAHGGPLDRVDRPRARPQPIHRGLLGQQARPGVATRTQARRPRRPRADGVGAARGGRPVDPGDRGCAECEPGDRPPLARQARPPHTATALLPTGRAEARGDHARVRAPWLDDVRAGWWAALPLRALQLRVRGRATTSHQGDPRAGSGRQLPHLRLRAVLGALQFHHIDPTRKSFSLGREGVTRSLAKAREEARKCVLLCANCHAMVEAGLLDLGPPADDAGSTTELHGRG
jgi:hypothetical protein